MVKMRGLWNDVGFALRGLFRAPGFTVITIGTLALGIGAGTAMFSVLNGVLLRELPLQDEEDVVVLRKAAPAGGPIDHLPIFQGEFAAFQAQTRTLQTVAGVNFLGADEQVLRDAGQPLSATGTWVTGDFFPLLGITPVHGRTLLPSDDVPGAAPVMVIGYGFWQRYFGEDPAALGQVLERNGKPFTVVGVLPRGFEFPKGAEFWMPVLGVFGPSNFAYEIVGRLRRGATVQNAREDYEGFLRETYPNVPAAFRDLKPVAIPLLQLITGDVRATLWISAAAVALLLLIACANVANVLLIRGSSRTQELAIRTALGAGRRRLIRQLLTESGVLALLGGVLGIVIAFAAVRVLVILAPPELPRPEMIQVDARVLLFALGITAAAAVLSGLLPAVLSAAADLRPGSRTASANRSTHALRHSLVIGQVSLAVLVVVGAGLLVRSLVALQSVDMGFNDERLLILQTHLQPDLVLEPSQGLALWEDLLARVASIPDVEEAASLVGRPFSARSSTAVYSGEEQTLETQGTNPLLNFEQVGPEYFRTMEIPILQGRAFSADDREDAVRVAIVSEAVVRHTWLGEDPVGKRIKLGPPNAPTE